MFHLRGELVAPSETTRFAGAARNGFTNQGPVTRAVFMDQSLKGIVLFRTPRAFDSIGLFGHGSKEKEKRKKRKKERRFGRGIIMGGVGELGDI